MVKGIFFVQMIPVVFTSLDRLFCKRGVIICFTLIFFMFRTVVSETPLEIGEIVVDVCCIRDSLSSKS